MWVFHLIDIKMNIIHKLYFELFDQLGEKNGSHSKAINLKRYINGISKLIMMQNTEVIVSLMQKPLRVLYLTM